MGMMPSQAALFSLPHSPLSGNTLYTSKTNLLDLNMILIIICTIENHRMSIRGDLGRIWDFLFSEKLLQAFVAYVLDLLKNELIFKPVL